MHFLLSSMSMVYVLTTPMPEDGGDNLTVEQVRKRAKWDNDDYVCRGLILNGMSNYLFDIYQNVESSKELWDSLEAKYMAEDASSKKFLVSCIIDKLPPSWKDFKHTLKHLKEELTLIELGSRLRIKESLRVQDSDKPKDNNVAGPLVVNRVEHNNSSWDYKVVNVDNKANGSGTKASVDGSSNSLKDDDVAWWVDSGATVHILGHVYFKRMQDMSKDGLIPAFDIDTKKCKTCMLTKITKKPFQNVKCETEVLELIYSDLCDLHVTPSLSNKRYFVIFVDDASRAVVRLPDPKLKTLGEKGIECIFVGYVKHSKAFRFFVIEPNESVSINSIIESRDAIIDENRFSSVLRPSLRILNGTEDVGGSVVPEEVTEEDVAFWKEAINDKMDSIMGNNTWVLDDNLLGFKQKSGIDYFDTYAPVARISTIRLLIAMTSIYNLVIHQMDVKITFLYGKLEEEQAPKQWHQKFDEVVLSNGYLLNQADKCVDSTKEFLSSRFSMKDMGGEADVILGIRIKHKSNGISISESHYIEKVLKKFNYFDCTPVSTPMDTSEKLMPNNGQAVSQLKYYRMIGCLMYAMTCTMPDIAFAVGKLSRYTSNPGTQHWQAIQRVLKYLKKTMDYRLTYTGYPLVLEGYTNASWISNTEYNSSTSGWVFLLGGGAISWSFKKQTCITGSTMEYEFVALAAAGKEAEWLKNLLLEIPLWSKPIAPISIRCDSAATLAKAYSQMYNGKSRHLGVRHSMIRELITNGVISIEFVRSQQNLADHLTKGLARDLVIKSAEGMGLKSN
ncbi:zinc finger, CCHC-type containing protein [Tanacetum coccineum]